MQLEKIYKNNKMIYKVIKYIKNILYIFLCITKRRND